LKRGELFGLQMDVCLLGGFCRGAEHGAGASVSTTPKSLFDKQYQICASSCHSRTSSS